MNYSTKELFSFNESTNELKYFYSTKLSLNIWSTKYKLEN